MSSAPTNPAEGMPRDHERPTARGALLVLTALTVLLRLAVILAPPAILDGPRGNGFPEELWRGVAAQELVDGPLLPFFEYQVNAFSGGSLVYALLTVPSFLVLGPTMVAMRLPTILFAWLAVLFAFLVLDRWVGRRAAWSGGLLLALVPPGYASVSSIAWGTHLEGNGLAMLLLYLFLRAHQRRGESARASLLAGLAAGFSLYFGYVAAIVLGAMLLVDLRADRRFLLGRDLRWRLVGFLIGFAPWIAFNLGTGFSGLREMYGKSLIGHVRESKTVGGVLEKLADLFQGGFPTVFSMPDLLGVSGRVWDAGLCIALGALALIGLFTWRSEPQAPRPVTVAAFYLPLFLLAYLVTDFRIDPSRAERCRYAMPPYPWIVLAASTGVDLLARRGLGKAAVVFPIAIAGLCGLGTASECRPEQFARIRSAPAAPINILARTIFTKGPTDRERIAAAIEGLLVHRPAETQHQFLFVLGQNYKAVVRRPASDKPRGPSVAEHAEMLDWLRERVPEEYRPYFERPRPGDGTFAPFAPEDRARFWKRWEERR